MIWQSAVRRLEIGFLYTTQRFVLHMFALAIYHASHPRAAPIQVYSTCTFAPAENEKLCLQFLADVSYALWLQILILLNWFGSGPVRLFSVVCATEDLNHVGDTLVLNSNSSLLSEQNLNP